MFKFIFLKENGKNVYLMSLWCYSEVIKLIKKARMAGCLLYVIGREAVLLVQLGEEWVPTDPHRAAKANDERGWSWWQRWNWRAIGSRSAADGINSCGDRRGGCSKEMSGSRQKHRRWKTNVQTIIDRCKERLRCRERWDKPRGSDSHQRHSRWPK